MESFSRSRARGGRPLTLITIVAGALGCGGPDVVQPGSGEHSGVLADLVHDAEEAVDVQRDAEVIASFKATRANRSEAPWVIETSGEIVSTMLQPAGGTEDRGEMIPGIAVRGPGPKSFAYPVESMAGQVTSVLAFVTCYGTGTERVRAVAYDPAGEEREASAWQLVPARRAPHALVFEIAAPEISGTPRAGVRLEFEGQVNHAALMSMALQSQKPSARMPTVGAPEYIQRNESWRACAGLAEGVPWECEVAFPGSPETPESIQFSLTLPSWSDGNSRGMRLYVSISRDGEEVAARSILVDELSTERWEDMSIDLGSVAAGVATVRLELEDDDDGESAVALVGDAVVVEPTTRARTVLLITSDTHRADYLGIYGARPFADTPALNALGRRGTYFRNAFSTTNVTNPSHIAIMTGLHCRDTQIVDNRTRLTERAETLAEHFRANGYRTFAAISTQHLGPDQSGLGQGFGRLDSPPDAKRSGNVAIDRVQDWVEGANGQSVFAWVHVFDAHAPYDPPSAQLARYTKGVPKSRDGGLSMDVGDLPWWVRREGIGNEDYVNALYAGEVDFVDRALSDLLDLERMRTALIAFTADHGESLTTHSVYWDHLGMYLPNLAVPLVLAGPGLDAVESDVPVHQSNVGRTLLDLSGIDVEYPGENLLEIAVENQRIEPLFGLSAHGLQGSVTLEHWHLILDLRDRGQEKRGHEFVKGRTRLYDRRSGIDTEQDVSEENPEVTAELRAALIKWLGEGSTEALGSAIHVTEQAAENLRVLGYTGTTERTSSDWYTPSPGDEGR